MAPRPQNNRLSNEDLHDDILSSMGVEDDDDTTGSVVGNDDDDNDDLNDDHLDNDDDDEIDGKARKGKKNDDDDDDLDELTRRYPEDPKTKDLVDNKGRVVARAGKERSLLERTKHALAAEQGKVKAVALQLRKVAEAGQLALEKYKEAKQQAEYYKTVGLDDKQAKEAIDLYARFNSDPKGALKYIMSKVHLAGVDLSDLGVTQPLDAKAIADEAIRRHLDTTKPVEKTPIERATEEARSFLDRFPDSYDMRGIIAEAKRQYPDKTLDEIYVKLKVHAAVHKLARQYGLDLSKPPRRGDAPRGRQPENNNSRQQQQRNAPVAHNSVDRGSKRRALDLSPRDHNASFSDIGKELLRDIKDLEGR